MFGFTGSHYTENYVKAEQTEKIRRAERARRVREVLKGKRGQVRFYQPLLATVGTGLVAVGTALQARSQQVAQVNQVALAGQKRG